MEKTTETIQLRTQQLIASAYSNQRMLTRHIRDTINQLVYIEHTKKMKTSQNTHTPTHTTLTHIHLYIHIQTYTKIAKFVPKRNLYLQTK